MQTPDVNQPVLLRGEEGEFASRVEGIADGALTLARPFGLPLETRLDDGIPFEVQWTSGAGQHTLPVRVTERAVDGRIRIWHAELLGPARVTNRRSHVRVSVAVPLLIDLGDVTVMASLLDVSEAALRCQVSEALPEVPARPEQEDGEEPTVRVRFALGEASFDLQATLFRSTPSRGATELVLTLPEDERTATTLRRAVFAEQIRARQRSR